MNIFIRQFLWLIFALSLLIFSLGVSWQISKLSNFYYNTWYQVLSIEEVIEKQIPINTQGKTDFPITNTALHQQMFADIVAAIHNQGFGLSTISYRNLKGNIRPLLTQSEVIHLQDVANLLTKITNIWLINMLVLLCFLDFYCHGYFSKLLTAKVKIQRLIMPTGKGKLLSILCFFVFLVIIFSLWGFTDIFYYLHTLVFPVEHQWFFYYRDSLMSTLMKAPDIFAVIAAQLFLFASCVFWVVERLIQRVSTRMV